MADKAIGVHLKDWHIVQGVRTGNSPWSPIAIAQVPVKEPAPSAPSIESVTAPEASAGVLEIKVSLPETNADGTALARAELVKLRLHHSTSSGVTGSDPYVDFPPSETLLWAPNDTVTHYLRVRVQDSHGLWSELSNEASGQAKASLPQEDSGLWAHRLGVESVFTNDSPDPGYVSWSNVVLYWKDNKYEIADGSTNKKYIWWDYSVSTTTFQTSDTRPELELEDVIVGYNDNGTWRLMCYQPTVMADYVRAGVLQSSNWGATTGSQFNLDDGTFKLGGSDSPKLSWDGSTLSIQGYLAGETLDDVPDGTTYGRVLKTDISAGHIILSACEGDLDDIADGTTYKRTTAEEKEGASRAYSGLDSSGRLVTAVLPSTPVSTPGTSGLYLGSDYLGYFDGSTWKTYMDNTGRLYLDGTNGYLHWDPSLDSLEIRGTVMVAGGWLGGSDGVTVDSSGLDVGSSGRIKGGATGFESGAGFWLGYSGGYKFYIGNKSTDNYLSWDGSTLTVRGDLSVDTISFDKITAGTNTASLTIGSGGYIQSANYSPGSAGFKISGSGDAEFNDVTVRGALITGSGSQINGDYITAGTITGRTVQTSSGYPKAIMAPTVGGYSHALAIYNSSGNVETAIWEGQIGLWNNSGTQTFQLYGDDGTGTAKMEFRTSGGQIYFWNGGRIYGTSSNPVELQHTCGRFSYSGDIVFSGACPSSWTDLDLSSVVGTRRALVFLMVRADAGVTSKKYKFRRNGETREFSYGSDWPQCSACTVAIGECGTVWVVTDENGVIEWMSGQSHDTTVWVLAYIT